MFRDTPRMYSHVMKLVGVRALDEDVIQSGETPESRLKLAKLPADEPEVQIGLQGAGVPCPTPFDHIDDCWGAPPSQQLKRRKPRPKRRPRLI
ncbi:hypothetical protein NDU88_006291 [Pleurodeles waltl]|uniref:Uncharacterized protein n=1 Tax=Pleurodeles waltl TaxID=8319 RepID=A0AAV7RP46_PLEWA|nr:hypothetical protein NDU88_006291 [Pleurodeles waltl]